LPRSGDHWSPLPFTLGKTAFPVGAVIDRPVRMPERRGRRSLQFFAVFPNKS
ncbi:MAG: hypothetical protein GX376_06550, partial [Firmicutes bacterium]|nr:hypothetical protein [Bacillota bacterium]